ncbi:hypothetical protein APHDU1_1123 [Anaplasma phagocytophilum]|uniref:Uncharacterized protein n=1 Tax=Anaplasma phagocytophilum str. NCH-1 TaxID=1359161 RepID=A0A0F3NK90_ANAPH|nr:hypothetical protein EPHNCH_0593 [Anaplasma phagocytophilum str. NCH-1]KKA00070.1 hypothetical protein APHDU1_1123 [Anaplasma phagocytophilum]
MLYVVYSFVENSNERCVKLWYITNSSSRSCFSYYRGRE